MVQEKQIEDLVGKRYMSLFLGRLFYRSLSLLRVVNKSLYLAIIRFIDKYRLISLAMIYDDKYFLIRSLWVNDVDKVVSVLYDEFHPKSVIDFGCGIGLYLKKFQDRGVKDLVGIEGSSVALKYSIVNRNLIRLHDLRFPLSLGRRFDLALCIEVAEHIHEAYEDVLLDTICSAANIIAFSSPEPSFTGWHHVNEQPRTHWISKMGLRGFIFDPQVTWKLKKRIGQLEYIPWVKNNLMIFLREK